MTRQAELDRALERRCEDCEAHKFEAAFLAMQSDAEDLLVKAESLLRSLKLSASGNALQKRVALGKAIDAFERKHIQGEREVVTAAGATGQTLEGAPR